MKTGGILLFAIFLWGSVAVSRAEDSITFQDFYDALTPHGDWVELADYGYCWRPFVDDHWRPYTDGQWVYTDAGYTWLSNEPWGWATYHYGRWTKVQGWGWVWVPGYEWGPAWVSWRANDEYIGWAALPPEAVWTPSAGFSVFVDIDYGIGPDWYAFCPVRYFCAPRLRTVCLPWRSNLSLINSTANITRICNNPGGIIFNTGPDVNVINRCAEMPLRHARLACERQIDRGRLREGHLQSHLDGGTLRVPSPHVRASDARPTRISGRAGAGQIHSGWESAAANPEAARQYQDRLRAEARNSGRQVTYPAIPESQPSSARAARGGTGVEPPPHWQQTPAREHALRHFADSPADSHGVRQMEAGDALRQRALQSQRSIPQTGISGQGEQSQYGQPTSRPHVQDSRDIRQQQAAELRDRVQQAQREFTDRQRHQPGSSQWQTRPPIQQQSGQQQLWRQQIQQQREQYQQQQRQRRLPGY